MPPEDEKEQPSEKSQAEPEPGSAGETAASKPGPAGPPPGPDDEPKDKIMKEETTTEGVPGDPEIPAKPKQDLLRPDQPRSMGV